MFHVYRYFTLLIFIVVCVGCNSYKVVKVYDDDGKPIAGAEVEAVSLSINSAPNLTDDEGKTTLPFNIQGTKWVQVSKSGYRFAQVGVPERWPLIITLEKDE